MKTLLGADVQPLGRQAVLYGVIYALTERLRSVFVPYFRYVMDGAIALLAGHAGDASQPKKKRKKSKSLAPISDVAAADAGAALNTWLLRFRVEPLLLSPHCPVSEALHNGLVISHFPW